MGELCLDAFLFGLTPACISSCISIFMLPNLHKHRQLKFSMKVGNWEMAPRICYAICTIAHSCLSFHLILLFVVSLLMNYSVISGDQWQDWKEKYPYMWGAFCFTWENSMKGGMENGCSVVLFLIFLRVQYNSKDRHIISCLQIIRLYMNLSK